MKAFLFVAFLQPAAVCEPDPGTSLAGLGDAIADASREAPCSLTLGEAIASMSGSPQSRALLEGVAAAIAKETGREITPAEIDGWLSNPAVADSLMTVSVPQVVGALKKIQETRGGNAPEPIAFKLPSGVDLADAPSYFDGEVEGPKEIAPGILRGDTPSGLDPEKVKAHRALGEVLDRLASNAGVPAGERFRVTYKGRSYSTIDGLLRALEANGHQVGGAVAQGVANFVDVQLARPDGGFCEVRTPVLVRTGHFAPDGTEILVPAVHSGLKLDVSGPDVNARVSFYQGVGGTRFFASGLGKDQSWVGGHEVEHFSGADAIRAASIAGLWRDTVEDMVAADRLIGGGYGQTGVCNDSVALVQMILTGRTTIYPLAMDKERVLRHLDAKIAEGGANARRYGVLRDAVTKLPFDGESDPTQPGRILDSIPYGETAPFPGVDLARRVLRDEG